VALKSKRLRFEILKRDGFACVYCGKTPMQSILHVDHVVPVSKGGGDDPENLVTSCQECNGGKSNIPLNESRLPSSARRSAADVTEQAEQLREYLAAQKELAEAREAIVDELLAHWERIGGDAPYEARVALRRWIEEFSFEDLAGFIEHAVRKVSNHRGQVSYVGACVRNQRQERVVGYDLASLLRKLAQLGYRNLRAIVDGTTRSITWKPGPGGPREMPDDIFEQVWPHFESLLLLNKVA
jgi:hypothetical protein